MTRRDLLKMLPLAGLGLWAGGAGPVRAAPAYFLLTDDPEGDLRRMIRSVPRAAMSVSRAPVAPSAQDLTLLVHGTPVDPLSARVPPGLTALAAEMRRRQRSAHTLLALEPRDENGGADVLFEVDGVPVERIPANRNYRRIEVGGVQGANAFRLENGRLSVIETSCRHEVCRQVGARSSGRIICAPNRIVASLPWPYGLVDAITG